MEFSAILDKPVPAPLKETSPQSPPNEIDIASVLDKYLEKMITLKKNFLANHYKTKDLSNQNKSVLSQAENFDIGKDAVPEVPNKSVSTEVSIYQIIENISVDELHDQKDDQKFIGNSNYARYLQKMSKYFKSVLSFVQKEKVKLDIKYVNYIVGIFVVNHVFQQEIDIAFRFFGFLVDVRLLVATQDHAFDSRGFF